MKSRIILVGKGGSGKDYLRAILEEELNLVYCVSHTSRPIREIEKEGIDYHFTDKNYFINNPEDFYEYVEFNGWIYGTSVEGFKKSDLLIMTPSGIKKLKADDRRDSFIIYIDIDKPIRRNRLKARNDADNTERRLATDDKDFSGFVDYDHTITNPSFGETEVALIKNLIK